MQRTLTAGAIAVVLSVMAVHAQATMTGKWQGETRNGIALVLDLTATNAELRGT